MLGYFHVVFRLNNQVLRRVGVAQIDSLVNITHQYKFRVFQRLLGNLFAWKEVQLTADSLLHVVDDFVRGCDKKYL